MNPILELLAKNSPENIAITNTINAIKSASNPQAMISQMAQKDIRFKQIMDIVNQYGGDPKTAFYEVCKQRGVDPNTILQQLR